VKDYDANPLAYVDDSPIHGKGLFARTDIAVDTYVGSYEGPATDDDGMHVLWVWNDRRDAWEGIDGKNEMRFLNHSADPNADWWGNELYAIRPISAGDEITFHYGEEWE
jgi:hypothetical protein